MALDRQIGNHAREAARLAQRIRVVRRNGPVADIRFLIVPAQPVGRVLVERPDVHPVGQEREPVRALHARGVLEEHEMVAVVAMKDFHLTATKVSGRRRAARLAYACVSIHVALTHVTHYHYDRLVGLSPQLVRLRPAPHCRTPILSYSLRVEPARHFIHWQQDPQSNYVARLTFPERVREFRIEVDLVAEMSVYNPFDFFLEPHAEHVPFAYAEWQRRELQPFLHQEPLTPRFAEYLASIPRNRQRTVDFLVDLNRTPARRHPLRDPPRPGRADPGTDARPRLRFVPRLHVAARAASAPSRLRGALRVRLSHPARTPTPSRSTVRSGPIRTSPTCTRGARSTCRAPGGSVSIRRPDCSPAKDTSRLSCTPEPASAAPVTGAVDECEVEFDHRMEVQRMLRIAARHQAVHRRAVDSDRRRWGAASTRARAGSTSG